MISINVAKNMNSLFFKEKAITFFMNLDIIFFLVCCQSLVNE